MTEDLLKEIARNCAKTKPQSYYSEPFEPHEWVIDAMKAAIHNGNAISEMQNLFEQAIVALASIDCELDLPDDGCNSIARTLLAIKKLKALCALLSQEVFLSTQQPEIGNLLSTESVGVQACRPEDREMLQSEAGKEMLAHAVAALREESAASAVPGWKLVPIESTEKIKGTFYDEMKRQGYKTFDIAGIDSEAIYKALIAATPTIPASKPDEFEQVCLDVIRELRKLNPHQPPEVVAEMASSIIANHPANKSEEV